MPSKVSPSQGASEPCSLCRRVPGSRSAQYRCACSGATAERNSSACSSFPLVNDTQGQELDRHVPRAFPGPRSLPPTEPVRETTRWLSRPSGRQTSAVRPGARRAAMDRPTLPALAAPALRSLPARRATTACLSSSGPDATTSGNHSCHPRRSASANHHLRADRHVVRPRGPD